MDGGDPIDDDGAAGTPPPGDRPDPDAGPVTPPRVGRRLRRAGWAAVAAVAVAVAAVGVATRPQGPSDDDGAPTTSAADEAGSTASEPSPSGSTAPPASVPPTTGAPTTDPTPTVPTAPDSPATPSESDLFPEPWPIPGPPPYVPVGTQPDEAPPTSLPARPLTGA